MFRTVQASYSGNQDSQLSGDLGERGRGDYKAGCWLGTFCYRDATTRQCGWSGSHLRHWVLDAVEQCCSYHCLLLISNGVGSTHSPELVNTILSAGEGHPSHSSIHISVTEHALPTQQSLLHRQHDILSLYCTYSQFRIKPFLSLPSNQLLLPDLELLGVLAAGKLQSLQQLCTSHVRNSNHCAPRKFHGLLCFRRDFLLLCAPLARYKVHWIESHVILTGPVCSVDGIG